MGPSPHLLQPQLPYPPHGRFPQPPLGMPWAMGPQMRAPAPASAMRRRFESEYMDADEIETILRIQWKSVHNGPAYVEDYYFQVLMRGTGVWTGGRAR